MLSSPLGIAHFRYRSNSMSKHLRTSAVHITVWARALGRYGLEALRYGWEAVRYSDSRVRMEILVTNSTRRRKIERELRTGLRQLRRILGDLPVADIGIVVQQVISTDRQLAGCCQLGYRPDGTQYALCRLALRVNGRPLSSDELLAVLAEQWMVLANHRNDSSVLVPVDIEPGEANLTRRPPRLRPDPLMPYGDGVNAHRA